MAFFDSDGNKVAGRLVLLGKGVQQDEISWEVAEAVERCRNKRYAGSPLNEIKLLFEKYPSFKGDTWAMGEHPVSPLIELYIMELFC